MRPSWDEYFMMLAKLAATRSTCRAVAVGTVIVKDRQILATGYNGPPAGFAHCTELGYCYEGVARCDQDQAYTSRATHAEANAIATAARKGIAVAGATLYTTLEPCLSCTKLILAAGISQVFYEEGLRTDSTRAQFCQEVHIPITPLALSAPTLARAVQYLTQPTSLKKPPDRPPTLLALDIDGVIRDVGGSYLRALADTVEHYTHGTLRPTLTQIDTLKSEGIWNNDWEASQELIYRHYEAQGQVRSEMVLDYRELVDFFQGRYLGQDFTGYIQDEALLVTKSFFEGWDQAGIYWGFVSGASRVSAQVVLEKRLGLGDPPLIAMGEAKEKPDPEGLLRLVERYTPAIERVVYCGDTVADILVIGRAASRDPSRSYRSIGILPPHNQSLAYRERLLEAGANLVLSRLEALDVQQLDALFS